MRVEAESISSHVAAIVAFEASGLRASSFRNGCNGFHGSSHVRVLRGIGEESEARVPGLGNKKGNKGEQIEA